MTFGAMRVTSLVIENTADDGRLGDFEIQADKDTLRMGFYNTATGVSRDVLMYKEDAEGPKAPAIAPYWQFNNDVRVADGHDLLVTGRVMLGGAPTEPMDAVTKAYADSIAVVPASLDDATDVEYTGTPGEGNVLAWNGTVWTNKTLGVPFWSEVYHYSGDMAAAPVDMVTGAGNRLSTPAPFEFTVRNLSISASNLPDYDTHEFTVLVKKADGSVIASLSSGAMPQRFVVYDASGVYAAWGNVVVPPFTIAAGDAYYVQLSGYTGTNIAVAVQLTSSVLGS